MLPNKQFTSVYHVEGKPLKVTIRTWNASDGVPQLSSVMSEDTETELIRIDAMTPKPVVAGFYSPDNQTVYIVDHESTEAFYGHLLKQCKRLWGYNTAFDIDTSGTNLAYEAMRRDILVDVRCNLFMHWFATKGDVRYDCLTLGACADKLLHMHLDKGEADGNEADRLTFKQGVEPTESQMVYLGGDVISTYYLGIKYMEYPTLALQTKADYVLSRITKNGIPVDKDVLHYWQDFVKHDMEEAAEKLRAFGFPIKEEVLTVPEIWAKAWEPIAKKYSCDVPEFASKDKCRIFLALLWKKVKTAQGGLHNLDEQSQYLQLFTDPEKEYKFDKELKTLYKEFCEQTELLPYDVSRKKAPYYEMVLKAIQLYFMEETTALDYHAKLKEWGNENASKLDAPEKPIGPTKFLQDYLKGLMEKYPGLQFEKTKTGSQWKYSKDDKWLLDDVSATSDFLQNYADYKHNEKMLSTYLKEEFVWPDGRMHPRFKVLVRSGRTASGGNTKCRDLNNVEIEIPGANLQNYPSRDAKYLLRNIFRAPEGYALCCTDFTGSELMSLAQDCYSRYGHSRLRELINAGVDVHYWFAGVIKGLIDPKKFKIEGTDVKGLTQMFHEKITKAERNFAKEPDFGSTNYLLYC